MGKTMSKISIHRARKFHRIKHERVKLLAIEKFLISSSFERQPANSILKWILRSHNCLASPLPLNNIISFIIVVVVIKTIRKKKEKLKFDSNWIASTKGRKVLEPKTERMSFSCHFRYEVWINNRFLLLFMQYFVYFFFLLVPPFLIFFYFFSAEWMMNIGWCSFIFRLKITNKNYS